MRHTLLLPGVLAFSAALAACGEEPTQPNVVNEAAPSSQLAVIHDRWITRAPLPLLQRQNVTASVRNAAGQSVVYSIGGANDRGSAVGRVQAYNVATNTWIRRKDLPTPLRNQNGAAVIGGKIYVSGGHSGNYLAPPTAYLYAYDLATNSWARRHDMPAPGGSGSSGVIGGKLYVVTQTTTTRTAFYRYDPATDRWVTLPAPSGRFGAGTVLNGRFYAIGASSGHAAGTRDLAVYDPTTNRWTLKAPLPGEGTLGLQNGGAVPLELKMYVIGEVATNPEIVGYQVRDVALLYDPVTNSWAERTPAPGLVWVYTASKVFVNGQPRIEVTAAAPSTGFSSYSANLQYIP